MNNKLSMIFLTNEWMIVWVSLYFWRPTNGQKQLTTPLFFYRKNPSYFPQIHICATVLSTVSGGKGFWWCFSLFFGAHSQVRAPQRHSHNTFRHLLPHQSGMEAERVPWGPGSKRQKAWDSISEGAWNAPVVLKSSKKCQPRRPPKGRSVNGYLREIANWLFVTKFTGVVGLKLAIDERGRMRPKTHHPMN